MADDLAQWASYLPVAESAYNNAVHESTKASSFSLVYVEPSDDFGKLPHREVRSHENDALQEAAASIGIGEGQSDQSKAGAKEEIRSRPSA